MNKTITLIGMLSLPAIAFALPVPGTLGFIIFGVGYVAGLILSIAATLAIVAFFWGIALYVLNINNDEKKVEEGKSWMLWSIVALFVMITIWGIIGLLQRTMLTNNEGPGKMDIVVPKL